MSTKQSVTTNASVEQAEKYDELGMRGLYESPHLAERPLSAHIENASALLVEAREAARTRAGDPLQPTVEGEYQAERDYDWTRDVDLSHDGHFGETLAQQERRLAEEQELARYGERARAAETAGLERERSARMVTEAERRMVRRDFEERAALARGEDPTGPDPRELLSPAKLAAVNRQAARLSTRILDGRWRAVLGRRLAQRVVNGQALPEASLAIAGSLYRESGVIQPIATLDPWDENADIEGVVTRLFEPSSPSIQQVGYVRDDSGSAKVTIWKKSAQATRLHEGDRVRISGGKPGVYKGTPTVAVVYDTRMAVLERGSGPGPVHRPGNGRGRKNGSEVAGGQRPRPCRAPSLSDARSQAVPRSAAARFHGRERWIFPAASCPDWFRERENVRVTGPEA